ncbi:MAG: zeta toxin family protein [Firmicutes bacterium]|nr:zeta toxin family protein [Bacillota bacterium]
MIPNELKKVFDYVGKSPWPDNVPDDVVFECGKRAAADMMQSGDYYSDKLIYRLAGQSGSGKTTQLLPTIMKFEQLRARNPITIAVRNFPIYHPDYDKIVAQFPAGEVREKTNGFALKCLAVAVREILSRGLLTVLDVTILDPIFEEFINGQIVENGYTAQYHILAVSRAQSDIFIEKRRRAAGGAESGKIVYAKTGDYFYDILPRGIEYLASVDRVSNALVWSAYDTTPLYTGHFRGVNEALTNGRRITRIPVLSEDEMRQAKLAFMHLYFYKIPVPDPLA